MTGGVSFEVAAAGLSHAEFERIALACDSILRSPTAHGSWLANPFLHVVSDHPVHQQLQRTALAARDRSAGLRHSVTRAVRHVRNLARGMRRSPRESARLGEIDVLLVGGLVDPGHLGLENDFYFGSLQNAFWARGLSSLLALRNQTGAQTRRLFEAAWRPGPCARVILPESLELKAELDLIDQARAGKAELLARRAEFDEQVAAAAARETSSPSTTGNLRLEAMIRELCRRLRPKLIVTLYEGHAWERCAWRGARRGRPGVLCAGYQHTIVRRHAHAMRRLLGRQLDPDVILCTGEVPVRILGEALGPGVRLITLGTQRRPQVPAPDAPSPRSDCLVLPEGLEREAVALFRFALDAARAMPTCRFILRSHPILPISSLRGLLPPRSEWPANVEESRATTLDEDLARAGRVLYRGSSAVIYAILAGLKPIYLTIPGEPSVDPLYLLDEWKECVVTVKDFVRLTADLGAADPDRIRAWRAACAFCRSYSYPIVDQAVDDLAALARAVA